MDNWTPRDWRRRLQESVDARKAKITAADSPQHRERLRRQVTWGEEALHRVDFVEELRNQQEESVILCHDPCYRTVFHFYMFNSETSEVVGDGEQSCHYCKRTLADGEEAERVSLE